ncbi:hypothetical protein KYK30_20620 [Shinella yambaruensis]|uniref:Phage tail assembly protein n=1 Tax=Shinella yambaruensis TaxID=415996 RepID=A0ABQ5ZER0_9HYPH|nr:hypothetical protein [Shinella yambaruensis]MCJ8027000.1 hypothetical protein [Shinella yambaruensis]MCU7982108.1 hypothetical protein [Shinella yambaruensis]GLR51283.1 hypothetical protein GCM10007923_24910 [Shinella yambaruensis]
MSSKPVSATVETPLSLNDKSDVAVEEIPLPPPEMWGELENDPAAAPAAPVPAKGVREIAVLEFVDGKPCRRIPLEYPFKDAERGQVTEIVVRRLTVGEVGDLLDHRPSSPDNFDIYALMTGFPAPVLRGLIDVDGEAVADACYDFFPRVFRPAKGAPSSPSTDGAA